MYYLLSLLSGAIISVMVLANGRLTGVTGVYSGSTIIHIVGLLVCILVLVIRKERVRLFPKGIPWYVYLGGVLGVWTTASNNIVFGKISVTAIVGLDLLGETVSSLIIDGFGLFGMPKRRISPLKLIGIGIVAAGIIILLYPFETSSLGIAIIGLTAGITVVVSRNVNGVLTESVGPMQSTLYNYITGLVGSLAALLLVGRGEAFFTTGALPTNFFAYTGGMMGVITVLVMNLVVKKVPAFVLTLLQFIAMAATSIAIDAFMAKGLDMGNLIGGICCFLGLLADLLTDRYLEKKRVKA